MSVLKPQQVWVRPGEARICLDDRKKVGQDQQETLISQVQSSCGAQELTALYCYAPEILFENKPHERSIIWSLGVLFYNLLLGRLPFLSNTHLSFLNEIKNFTFVFPEMAKNDFSEAIYNLLSRMICLRCDQRISLVKLQSTLECILHSEASLQRGTITCGYFWSETYQPKYLTQIELDDGLDKLDGLITICHRNHILNQTLRGHVDANLKHKRLCYRFLMFTIRSTVKLFDSTYKLKSNTEDLALLAVYAFAWLSETQFHAVLSNLKPVEQAFLEEKRRLLDYIKSISPNMHASESVKLTEDQAISCLQRLVEVITDTVIADSTQETVLQAAAWNVNLLLDCLNVGQTVLFHFRLDTGFESQSYIQTMRSFDFETLILLMNAKVEAANLAG